MAFGSLRIRPAMEYRENAIFIHIPKTAGTSLLQVMEVNPPADHLRHATAAVYQRMHPDLWRSAYKFTFVRDPMDRLASAFYFLQNKTEWGRLRLSAE